MTDRGLSWYDFAAKDDVAAHDFYGRLIDAKASGTGWTDTWLAVPRRILHNFASSSYSGGNARWWTGFEWVTVFDYETDGRVYVRLPQYGEVSE